MSNLPGRDRTHRWANYIVGFSIPRSFIRKLSIYKYETLIKYVTYMWYKANDNDPPVVARPKWLPKKYIWAPFK